MLCPWYTQHKHLIQKLAQNSGFYTIWFRSDIIQIEKKSYKFSKYALYNYNVYFKNLY